MDIKEKRIQDLFADRTPVEIKEKKPAKHLTLDKLQVVTIHYDLFSRLEELATERDIEYLIFKSQFALVFPAKNAV